MQEKTDLYILWTNDNPVTVEKMVFMYGINCLVKGWWEKVTIIIWGATANLVAENQKVQELVKQAQAAGVHMSACRACADQLEVAEKLESLGVEVIYWGQPLSRILKNEEALLTV